MGWLSFSRRSCSCRLTLAGLAVGPGALDEGLAGMGVAGFGDTTLAALAAAGVFGGGEAEVAHERSGVVEAGARNYHRSPDQLTGDERQAYFLYLVKERGLSGASCRLYLNGIRFLYVQVLIWSRFDIPLQVPKAAQRIPEFLTRAEVGQILSACGNPKHRMLLTTCYGCGLRVSELVALRVRDIDSERQLVRIEPGKGAKDRQVIIFPSLLEQLRDYWQRYPCSKCHRGRVQVVYALAPLGRGGG
jgi:integrase